jgi:hypothetical protein
MKNPPPRAPISTGIVTKVNRKTVNVLFDPDGTKTREWRVSPSFLELVPDEAVA